MVRSNLVIGAAALLILSPAGAQAPHPPPPGVKAPALLPLSPTEAAPLLKTPQHCALYRDKALLLVSSETGRQALVKPQGALVTLRYEGRNPIRSGGRFLASPAAFDLWIAFDPREDTSLAPTLPRHVVVMINGANGGSDAYQATYSCNY